MADDIKPGDRVEHKRKPELDSRPAHTVWEDLIWLTGPSGLPLGPFPLRNYRKVNRSNDSKEN